MGATPPDKPSLLFPASSAPDLLSPLRRREKEEVGGPQRRRGVLGKTTPTSGNLGQNPRLDTPPPSPSVERRPGKAVGKSNPPRSSTHEGQRGREASDREERGSVSLAELLGGFPVGGYEQGVHLPEGQAGRLGRGVHERRGLLLGALRVVAGILVQDGGHAEHRFAQVLWAAPIRGALDRQAEPGYLLSVSTASILASTQRLSGGDMAEEVLSSFCMRTTITVDGELAERIERLSRERATSFEDLADAALREGLEHLTGEAPQAGGEPEKKSGRISYTHPVSLGGCLLDSLDDITGAFAVAEGEDFK